MKKQAAISFVAGLAIALALILGLRGSEAEAATPALTLDPETGLPAGSLVFHVEDHTCVVLPTHEMECFCPCSSEVCGTRVEVVPLPSTTTFTITLPVTPVVPTTSDVPVPVPGSEPEPEPELEPESEPALKPESEPDDGENNQKGNNGLGNGEDPAPPGIAKQGKPQNDDSAEPGNPQYNKSGSDGQPNGKGGGNGKGKD